MSASPPLEEPRLPRGMGNAFAFAGFNALSFQIILSSPMVLYAKSIGASATVLGIIAGMMPLLVIFQIPAASYIPRVGYKRFVLAGWGIRVLFIFGMALVPLAGRFLNATTQLALLLLLLFGFNLSRGISSCAWLPWISSLVPPEVRGRYLVIDAAWVNLCSGLTFLLAAVCLGKSPEPWQFSSLFLFSALTGAMSLRFLNRIPDVPVSEPPGRSRGAVPWGEISKYRPFRKLLKLSVAWSIASGGMTAFTVAYLRGMGRMSEGAILLLSSVTFLGGLGSLWFVGSRLDRMGSKPVLNFSFGLWILIAAGWMLLAGGVLDLTIPTLLVLQFLMGLGSALVGMGMTRLVMSVVPPMGKNHFFALYSVLGSLALGLAPILWGLLIDGFHALHLEWGGLLWNRYTLFFAAVVICLAITAVFGFQLEEREAKRLEDLLRDLLIESPQRVWVRLWPRH